MTASPDETVMGFIVGPWLAQAVRAAVDLSLAEHLADGPRTAGGTTVVDVGGARAAAVERGLDDRFVAVAGDVFKAVPQGDILPLTFILHDWPDDLLTRAGLRRTAATPVEPPYVVIEATAAA